MSLEIKGKAATGETTGVAHSVVIALPTNYGEATVIVDGKTVEANREGNSLTVHLPEGAHAFAVAPK